MRRREVEQSRPERRPWVRAMLSGEAYTFRLPTPATLQRLSKAWQEAGDDMAARQVACGLWIGAAFDDPAWELESAPTDGAAIYEEAHSQGWRFPAIAALIAGLAERAAEDFIGEEEVATTARFFDEKAPREPISSPSGPSTSATPGGGIA